MVARAEAADARSQLLNERKEHVEQVRRMADDIETAQAAALTFRRQLVQTQHRFEKRHHEMSKEIAAARAEAAAAERERNLLRSRSSSRQEEVVEDRARWQATPLSRPGCSCWSGMFFPAIGHLPAAQCLGRGPGPSRRGVLVATGVLGSDAVAMFLELLSMRKNSAMYCVQNGDGTTDGTGRMHKTNTRLVYHYVPPQMPTPSRLDDVAAWRSVSTVLAALAGSLEDGCGAGYSPICGQPGCANCSLGTPTWWSHGGGPPTSPLFHASLLCSALCFVSSPALTACGAAKLTSVSPDRR